MTLVGRTDDRQRIRELLEAERRVPAVIHLSPEALLQGPIGKVVTGDMLVIDAEAGVLDVEIDAAEWAARPEAVPQHQAENEVGFGRELFGVFRAAAAPAELGASVFGPMVGEVHASHALQKQGV